MHTVRFVVLCFVVVMQSFIMNSHEVFIHIHQGCFAGTGAIVRLPQCQWSKPDGYGEISQCITTTKHSKAKTVCIFLGIYCITINAFQFLYPSNCIIVPKYSLLKTSMAAYFALTWVSCNPIFIWWWHPGDTGSKTQLYFLMSQNITFRGIVDNFALNHMTFLSKPYIYVSLFTMSYCSVNSEVRIWLWI